MLVVIDNMFHTYTLFMTPREVSQGEKGAGRQRGGAGFSEVEGGARNKIWLPGALGEFYDYLYTHSRFVSYKLTKLRGYVNLNPNTRIHHGHWSGLHVLQKLTHASMKVVHIALRQLHSYTL